MVVSPQALAELITEPTVLLGDGIAAYGDFFKETLGERALMAPAATHFARSAAIGMLGVELWKRNEFLDPATAVPLYIRQSEAELLFGQAGKR